MKKVLQMILCLGLITFAFNQAEAQKISKKDKKLIEKSKTLIQRKWQFDGEFLKAEMKKEADKVRATNPEKAAELESQLEMIGSLAAGITMEFKADGVMEMGMMGQVEKGSWSLEEKGKVLVMTNSSGKVDRVNIKEASESKLVLENPKDDNMKVIALIAAK